MKPFKGYGLYISPELQGSKAWNDIGVRGHRLFYDLHNGLRYRRKKDGIHFTNNGELFFTEKQYCEKYNCSKDVYTNARNDSIRVGLIRMTYRGGNGKGDYSTYKLTYLNNTSPLPNGDKPRWKFYDGDKINWENEIPKSKSKVGNKTQFQKGECGRNRKKSTLSKHTLNGTNPPIETYPLNEERI